jgi:hypothetical protein
VREFAQEPWDTSCICEKEEEEEGDAWREGGEKEWEGEGEEKVSEREEGDVSLGQVVWSW